MREWRDVMARAPDDLTCWIAARKAPPLPFLPETWRGREVLLLALLWAGNPAAGEEGTRALRSIGKPIADVVGPTPCTAFQQILDPLPTPGSRNYPCRPRPTRTATPSSCHERLAGLKERYDPTNLFRMNPNVPPGGA